MISRIEEIKKKKRSLQATKGDSDINESSESKKRNMYDNIENDESKSVDKNTNDVSNIIICSCQSNNA